MSAEYQTITMTCAESRVNWAGKKLQLVLDVDATTPAEFLQLTRMVARNAKVQVTVDLNDLK